MKIADMAFPLSDVEMIVSVPNSGSNNCQLHCTSIEAASRDNSSHMRQECLILEWGFRGGITSVVVSLQCPGSPA